MNVGIVGSRSFTNYKKFEQVLDKYFENKNVNMIVSGGARGVDSMAARYAKEHKISLTEYLPEWDRYGKRAGFLRNTTIVENSDLVIAFWDGRSRGTLDDIKKARKYNKKLQIFRF